MRNAHQMLSERMSLVSDTHNPSEMNDTLSRTLADDP